MDINIFCFSVPLLSLSSLYLSSPLVFLCFPALLPPPSSSQHSKKVQHHSQLEDDLQALTVKEGNTEKNENDNAENSGENVQRPKSPLGGWSLTENPAPEPDQKEALSRLSLHKDDNPGVSPPEGGNSERDNMTNGEDDGFHEEEADMKGRADGRQGVEDVIEHNTDDAIPEESANNTVEEEP